jgi:hypothetical protein
MAFEVRNDKLNDAENMKRLVEGSKRTITYGNSGDLQPRQSCRRLRKPAN